MSNTPIVTKRYYTPEELASITGFSTALIYRKINSGEIPAVSLFRSNRKLIAREWADEYLARLEREAREEAAAKAEERRLEARRLHIVRRTRKK